MYCYRRYNNDDRKYAIIDEINLIKYYLFTKRGKVIFSSPDANGILSNYETKW